MLSSRRQFLKRVSYGAAGVSLAGVSGYLYGTRIETEMLRLEKVEIPINKLPPALDGFRISLLSDFHLFPHTTKELIGRAVDLSNSLKPDMVILGGDYVLRTAESIFDLGPILGRLDAKHGLYAILGNHDHWQGDAMVVQGLEREGIPVLRNQSVSVPVGNSRFWLAGLDDGWVRKHDISQALEGRSSDEFTILLMHEPDFADDFAFGRGVSLQLSGHSHGGQVRLPFWGSPFLPPYGRKYDKGLYRVGDMQLFTTVGIGVTAPIRINCPPEIAEVTLVQA